MIQLSSRALCALQVTAPVSTHINPGSLTAQTEPFSTQTPLGSLIAPLIHRAWLLPCFHINDPFSRRSPLHVPFSALGMARPTLCTLVTSFVHGSCGWLHPQIGDTHKYSSPYVIHSRVAKSTVSATQALRPSPSFPRLSGTGPVPSDRDRRRRALPGIRPATVSAPPPYPPRHRIRPATLQSPSTAPSRHMRL